MSEQPKRWSPWGILALAVLVAAVALGLAGRMADRPRPPMIAAPTANPTGEARTSAPVPAVRQIEDVEKVCMVNDTLFAQGQIPVVVEGRTYYGCCEMCKERIASDPAVRSATDPASGAPVDKATAVIGALPDGRTLYFESEENLQAYRKQLG